MDFREEQPIFSQIAERLEDAILSGAYGEEQQVPSITEFSVAYKINPATALKGVNVLANAGLLYKRRGVGMFVAKGAKEQILSARREQFYAGHALNTVREAKKLGIRKDDLIDMIERGYSEHGDLD